MSDEVVEAAQVRSYKSRCETRMTEPAEPDTIRLSAETGFGRPQPGGAHFTLLGSLGGWVAWLGSSLGVIAALLYASGYLISVAQLHLLGLGRLVTYSHEHFVQQGGTFFLYMGEEIMTAGEYFSILFIPVLGVFALRHWVGAAWRHNVKRIVAGRSIPWRGLAYAVLIALLLLTGGDPKSFGQPLTLSNLLFLDPSAATSDPVRDALVAGKRDPLLGQFEDRLFRDIFVLLQFVASFFVTQTWPLRRLAVLPFALLFLVYTLLLPMLFGVLALPVEFPVVTVRLSGDVPLQPAGAVYLLNKGDGEVVLYEAVERDVLWLDQGRIERIVVDGVAPILQHATPLAKGQR